MVFFFAHQSEAGKRFSDFYANQSEQAERFNISEITDAVIKLQLISLQDKGSSVLPAEKAAKVADGCRFHSRFAVVCVDTARHTSVTV